MTAPARPAARSPIVIRTHDIAWSAAGPSHTDGGRRHHRAWHDTGVMVRHAVDVTDPNPEPTGRRPLPIYLGPALPRWQPRTIDDVQAAIDDGTLRERHWLDVKGLIASSDGARKDLAQDLVSFANDGGGLLIGVYEDKPTQTLTVRPVPLDGLAERIDQVARSRCDPPLYVVCHPLSSPMEDGARATGVLLVEVPPSPSAPHMTNGRYYGRGDTTNRILTDGEVAQLHAIRSGRQLTAERVIAAEVARNPVPTEHSELSHLFVVAQPLASPPDLLTPLIGSRELSALISGVPDRVPGSGNFSPHWGHLATHNEPRAQGSGFRSYGMLGRRFLPDLQDAQEGALLDVEVHDNGQVTLFCGRASDKLGDEQHVLDAAVVGLTRCITTLAGELGATAGYAGRWLLAVGVTDLAGKYTSSAVNTIRLGRSYSPFSADTYIDGTEAMTSELLNQPGAVTRRLVARLLRALGNDAGVHDQALADGRPESS